MSLSFLTLTLPLVLDTTNSKEPLSYRDSIIEIEKRKSLTALTAP